MTFTLIIPMMKLLVAIGLPWHSDKRAGYSPRTRSIRFMAACLFHSSPAFVRSNSRLVRSSKKLGRKPQP